MSDAPPVDDPVAGMLVGAVRQTDDPVVAYHARSALQRLVLVDEVGATFGLVSKRDNGLVETTPYVGYTASSGQRFLRFLLAAYEAMDEPDAVTAFVDPPFVGFEPADADAPNAYPIQEDPTPRIAAGWIRHELGVDPEPGRYRLVPDDETGLWIVDFSDPSEVYDGGEEADDDA